MGEALAEHEGSVVLDTWVHDSIEKLCKLGLVQAHERLLKFSIVRHPADYLVTKYHHLTGWHKKGFRSFLRSQLESHDSLFMHANDTDRTLRYEALLPQLNDILEARGAPPIKLNVVGKTEGKKPWRSYYSEKDLRILPTVLHEFQTFGYTL